MKQLLSEGHNTLRISFFLVLALIVGCTNAQQSGKIERSVDTPKVSSQSVYPDIIVEKGLQELYDSSKWSLYLFSCTDTPIDYNSKYFFENPKPLSAYELKFDSLLQVEDTFVCLFNFYLNDTLKITRRMKNSYILSLPNGIVLTKKKNKRCLHFNNGGGFEAEMTCLTITPIANNKKRQIASKTKNTTDSSVFVRRTLEEKLFDPPTPYMIYFLNRNQKDLNPWFVEQAKKRGVIK